MQRVVPVWVEGVSLDTLAFEAQHVAVGDLDAGRVEPGVEFGLHGQSGAGGDRPDEVDDGVVAGQWGPFPVHRDVGDKSVFNLVPLRCSRGQVADGDGQARVGGERGEFCFEGPQPGAVGTAAVGGDQETVRLGVGATAFAFPPGAQRRDGEGRGVVVAAHRYPASVGADVVDAVGDGFTPVAGEVVHVDLLRRSAGAPGGAVVLVLADEFLLLRIDTDHRLPGRQVLADPLVQVPELLVPVGVLAAGQPVVS